ncbi:MAG: CapA family protein [Patescibacteria group bacterium]
MNKNIFSFLIFIFLICLIFLSGFFVRKYFFLTKNDLVKNDKLIPLNINKADFLNKKNDKVFAYPQKKFSLFIAGDIMLDRSVQEKITSSGKGDYSFPFAFINEDLKTYNIKLANLEGPITDFKSIAEPNKPIFTFSTQFLPILSENFDLFNLANNHTYNFGFNGLLQTRDYLSKNNLNYFGDPNNEQQNLSFVIKQNDLKIGVISYNDLIDFDFNIVLDEIEKIKSDQVNFIIVFPHWGTEYVYRPNSKQIEEAHLLIDAGADLIVGGHPHVIQSIEKYKEKFIFYSLGNFVFDQYFADDTMTGLTLVLNFWQEKNEIKNEIEIKPIKINKDCQVFFADQIQNEETLKFLIDNSDIDIILQNQILSGILK